MVCHGFLSDLEKHEEVVVLKSQFSSLPPTQEPLQITAWVNPHLAAQHPLAVQ